MNSDTLKPACRIIARSVPLSSSLWSGTTSCANGSSRRITIWLPSCLIKRNPTFVSALIQSRPDILGSVLIRLSREFRSALQAQRCYLVPAQQCMHLLLPVYSILPLLWSVPGLRNQASSGTRRPNIHLLLGRLLLASYSSPIHRVCCACLTEL